ncbi:MAG: SLC13 family permease [Lachnospiraceae bacterium]
MSTNKSGIGKTTSLHSVSMDTKQLVKTLISFAVMVLFAVMPPIAPLTEMGMKVLGVFIGTVLLLSLVDTTWPAILCVPLFSLTGVMTVNEAIIGSLGNWITMFVIMSFVMTHALNESGFTSRLTAFYMSRKFVSRNPWTFTVALITLGMIVGWFLDPVPTVAFFMGFSGKIFRELGYTPEDRYPHMVTMALAFAINIAGGMTPISHPLAILGMGVYQAATGNVINLFTYMAFAVPVGLLIYIGMLVVLRLFFKPDMSKFKEFDINKVLDDAKPMDLREKITVSIFFGMVILWVLPGITSIVAPGTALNAVLNSYSATFWAIIAVVLIGFIEVDKKPVLDLKGTFSKMNWGTIFLVAAAILLGAAVTSDGVGLSQFVIEKTAPIIESLPTMLLVLFLTGVTSIMTNFTSNVTTITLMTGVSVTVALGSGGALDPLSITLITTMVGALAYMVPASFASIGVLYGDEYSHGGTIFKYGAITVVITTLVATFIGYPLAMLLS